jgi:formate dehydrogenase subunit gamma
MLRFPSPFAVSQRTGATFVHDWLALALAVLVAGHMLFALAHREELWSMVSGRIDRRREEKMAPLWLDELEALENAEADSEG